MWRIALAACVPVVTVLAQPAAQVFGTIQDSSGFPIPGATVQVRALNRGAVADAQGRFRLELPPGTHELEVRGVGYRSEQLRVSLAPGAVERLTIRLRPQAILLREIQVVGAQPVQSREDPRPSVVFVQPRTVKYRAGAVEDLLRALQTLPGITATSDFSSQLVIRGSTPDQNLILIDGFEVFNPYRLYGLVSMYNPETLADVQLSLGGFPARYGDRLSAVLDVTVRQGQRERPFSGMLSATLVNANVVVEGQLPFWQGSYLLASRRTYYDLIAGPIVRAVGLVDGDVALPNFGDLQLKLTVAPSSSHRLSTLWLLNRDNTELTSGARRQRPDSVSLFDESYNTLAGFTWDWVIAPNWSARLQLSAYNNHGRNQFGGEGGSELVLGSRDVTLEDFRRLQDSLRQLGIEVPRLFSVEGEGEFAFRKYSLLWEHVLTSLPAHQIEFGAGADWIDNELSFSLKLDPRLLALRESNPRIPKLPESYTVGTGALRTALYVQDRIRLGRFTLLPGLRWDYFGFIRRGYLSPRMALSYMLDEVTTVRGAWGIYYQSPGYEKLFDRQTFLDFTHPRARHLRAEAAAHWVAGVERMLSPEWQLRLELYYKRFWNLIVQERLAGTVWVTQLRSPEADPRNPQSWTPPVPVPGDSLTIIPVNGATGDAYGIELLLQRFYREGSPVYGWISYALSWAYRQQDGVRYPFNYDRRHVFNFVAGWRISPWLELNATWTYGTGFPWTAPVSVKPRVVVERDSTGAPVARIDTDWRGVVFQADRGGLDNLNRARLPDYHRLDLRLTAYADWLGKEWSLYLDVANVYNRANVLAIQYRVDPQTLAIESRPVRMLPILPTVGFTVRL